MRKEIEVGDDIDRLYAVCEQVRNRYTDRIDELAHTIAKDFDTTLEAEGFSLLIPIEGSVTMRHSIEYLVGLSRVSDLLLGWFRLRLSLGTLWHTEPGEFIDDNDWL